MVLSHNSRFVVFVVFFFVFLIFGLWSDFDCLARVSLIRRDDKKKKKKFTAEKLSFGASLVCCSFDCGVALLRRERELLHCFSIGRC